ncbi:MAG: hypothetical protein JSS02_22835 [Planctomycetes bacterium]|nr:hypothetical protein [Planctomycetota bacterium]
MDARYSRERLMEEARLKFERDQIWRLKAAKDEGRDEGWAEGWAEGIQLGELAGQIHVLQRVLGLSESTMSDLAALDIAQLTKLAAELQAQLKNRG